VSDARDLVKKCDPCQRFCTKTTCTCNRLNDNTLGLSFCTMGTRSSWSAAGIIARRAHIPIGRSRQVHQMDRSRTSQRLNS
jgi:hypothetical protein